MAYEWEVAEAKVKTNVANNEKTKKSTTAPKMHNKTMVHARIKWRCIIFNSVNIIKQTPI